MAKEKAPEAEAEVESERKKLPLRLIMLIGGGLVVEAAVIIGAMMLFGGPPQVEATEIAVTLDTPEDEKIVEVMVLDGSMATDNDLVVATRQQDHQLLQFDADRRLDLG